MAVDLGRALRGAGDEGGHDVAGVAVEVVARSVVAGRRPGIGVASGDLDVAKRDPGVEGRRFQQTGRAEDDEVRSVTVSPRLAEASVAARAEGYMCVS